MQFHVVRVSGKQHLILKPFCVSSSGFINGECVIWISTSDIRTCLSNYFKVSGGRFTWISSLWLVEGDSSGGTFTSLSGSGLVEGDSPGYLG